MKNLRKILLASVIVFGFSVNAASSLIDSKTEIERKEIPTPVKEGSIVLKAGMVIEIIYATIKGGGDENIQMEYFTKMKPIQAKYGSKLLGTFEVSAVTGGEVKPQIIYVFEWPSLASRDKLYADKEAQKLFPLRNVFLTSVQLAHYTVKEDTKLTFKNDKVYEFFNAWLTLDSKTALPIYFKESDASKKRYGSPKFLATLQPVTDASYLNLKGPYLHPHMAGIVEWNKTSDFYGLSADSEWKKAAVNLEKSVSRLDMIHVKYIFQD